MYSSFSQLCNTMPLSNNISDIITVNYGFTSITSSSKNTVAFPSSNTTLITATSDPITVEFFIRDENNYNLSSPGLFLFSIGNSTTSYLEFRYANQGLNRLHMYDPAAGGIFRYSTRGTDFSGGSTDTSNWHHVAFVYKTDDTNNHLYIDGKRTKNRTTFTETAECEYVNLGTTSTKLNTSLANTGLNMYILSHPTFSDNNLTSSRKTPIHSLRVTKTDVYTGDFTVPSSLDITNSGYSGNIKNFTTGCVLLVESYTINGTPVIRDKVQGINLTDKLQLITDSYSIKP